MRLKSVIVGLLVAIVFLMVGGVYLQTDWRPLSYSGGNRVESSLEEESRFQWVVLLESDDQLDGAYLFSFEPISENLVGIYVPPRGKLSSEYLYEIRSLGELHRELTPAELRDELEQALEVSIPFWVSLSRDQLKDLVDLIGGTRIELGQTLPSENDSGVPEDRWMDGALAVEYQSEAFQEHGLQGLRFRNKTLLMGLVERLNQEDELLEDERFQTDVQGLLSTNVRPDEWVTLTRALADLESSDIKFLAAREQTGLDGEGLLEASRFHQMFPRPLQKIIAESEPQELIRVQLLNGAGVSGLAGSVREFLQPYSDIDVVEVDNADHFNYEVTRVVDRSGNPQSAYRIKNLLGLGRIDTNLNEDVMVDVTIILGQDAVERMEGEGF